MAERMTEFVVFAAGTKVVRTAGGRWEPIPDDDPRARDARFSLAYPLMLIDGEPDTTNPFAVSGHGGGPSELLAHLMNQGTNGDFLADSFYFRRVSPAR
jgi:hypothetical protein